MFDEIELVLLKDIIEINFSDSDDLVRELIWIVDVYYVIGSLEVGELLKVGEILIVIMDILFVDNDG